MVPMKESKRPEQNIKKSKYLNTQSTETENRLSLELDWQLCLLEFYFYKEWQLTSNQFLTTINRYFFITEP